MRWLKSTLLVTALCSAYGQDSATRTEIITEITRENEINFQGSNPILTESTENVLNNLTVNLTQNAGNLKTADSQVLENEVEVVSKSGKKQEVENVTLNDIKPFLLFPILPFLFPPKEEENLKRDVFSNPKNETSKTDGSTTNVKPFIFFDFAFNIRRVSINNETDNSNDSEISNLEKIGNSENLQTSPQKSRERRHAKKKTDTPGFFDDSPLFPDSELDEFLPKPDLFFPDLPFHHKPVKKLNRKKRDQNNPQLKNDLKSFFDAFDEAFMQTKNELEWADPILNFLRNGEQFDEDKKDRFNQPPEIREKPSMKLRIQRNIKRLNNERQDGLIKAQDSPTIIVDKVVKIGEFHVHDKNKVKRDRKDSKGKFLGRDESTSVENLHIPTAVKHGDDKRKKRNHVVNSNPEGQTYAKIQTEEIRILPKLNTSFLSAGGKSAAELHKRENIDTKRIISMDETAKYQNLMQVIDSIKNKINAELTNEVPPTLENLRHEGSEAYEKQIVKGLLKENLKRNITELLNEFLSFVKKMDGAKLVEKLEGSEHDQAGIFDWTEKETLQNMPGKSSRANREKKGAYFEDEYSDLSMKERQVADLNYLFLGVTVPTVLVFTLVLLTCFYSLQVKGKICTKLFKTRQVFLVDNEIDTPIAERRTKKMQPI